MKRLHIAVCILILCTVGGTAAAQRMLTPTIPLNEIMPRLPPVPQPAQGGLIIDQCSFSPSVIPLGDVAPATRAEQTPEGIVLSGDAPPEPRQGAACSAPPD